MTSKVRWGVLGTSFISEVIAKAINESQTGELTAIGGRSHARLEQLANQLSIPKIYNNYHDLIVDKDIDAIYIGLPNHLHKEWIIRSAKAGKHILCEKPLVISKEEATEVISIIKQSNVYCMEALMYRYHPFTKSIYEIIESSVLGEVKLYNATYTAHIVDVANPTAGGCIRNLGCYPISLIRYLTNAEPTGIYGTGRLNKATNNDSQASVVLKFPDNAMAVVTTADDIKMIWQFDVYGTEGYMKVLTNPWLPNMAGNKILIHQYTKNKSTEIDVCADKSLYTYEIDCLNEKIINHANNDGVTLEDSLGNTIVLESWRQQVKTSEKNYCVHMI